MTLIKQFYYLNEGELVEMKAHTIKEEVHRLGTDLQKSIVVGYNKEGDRIWRVSMDVPNVILE